MTCIARVRRRTRMREFDWRPALVLVVDLFALVAVGFVSATRSSPYGATPTPTRDGRVTSVPYCPTPETATVPAVQLQPTEEATPTTGTSSTPTPTPTPTPSDTPVVVTRVVVVTTTPRGRAALPLTFNRKPRGVRP